MFHQSSLLSSATRNEDRHNGQYQDQRYLLRPKTDSLGLIQTKQNSKSLPTKISKRSTLCFNIYAFKHNKR